MLSPSFPLMFNPFLPEMMEHLGDPLGFFCGCWTVTCIYRLNILSPLQVLAFKHLLYFKCVCIISKANIDINVNIYVYYRKLKEIGKKYAVCFLF